MRLVNIPQKIINYNDKKLRNFISRDVLETYGHPSKPIQFNTVSNLEQAQNMFLLAATGFGKSEIPEMYLKLRGKDHKGKRQRSIVVLNQLNAL